MTGAESREVMRQGVSRREALKRALKAGAYTAPVILAVSVPAAVSAQVTPPPIPCVQPVTFFQDAILLGVAPGAAFDLYAQANTAAVPSRIGAFTADAFGVAVSAFAITLNTDSVSSVTTSVFLTGTAPPAPPAASFTSTLVTALACTASGLRAAAQLLVKVVQEQTGAGLTGWQERVDVVLVNAQPNTAYAVSIQPNTASAPTPTAAGTLTTNAQGNAGGVLNVPVTTTGTPTAVVVRAVGALPAPTLSPVTAAPTGNIATSTLITVSSTGTVTGFSLPTPRLLAIR